MLKRWYINVVSIKLSFVNFQEFFYTADYTAVAVSGKVGP